MLDSNELLKPFANRLAEKVTADEAVDLIRLLHHAGIVSAGKSRTESDSMIGHDVGSLRGSEPNVARIGIWQRTGSSGNFVRRLDLAADWYLWANVGRIGPKKCRRRVVLIGESVARGYLYDPQFNPARCLDSIFESQLGPGNVEVIDLARTNLKLEEMALLASSAFLLQPDAVVIFAGNNWLGAGFHATLTRELATALRESGVAGIKSLMEQKHHEAVTTVIGEIGGMYLSRCVPLVWVIPEFNLGDWRDPVMNAPYLQNGGNREWMDRYRQASNALDSGNADLAAELARGMAELDGGTSGAPFHILAECARNAGELVAMRSHLEAARDAVLWAPYLKTPRAYSLTHRTLREELGKYGIRVVDLPKLFGEYLNGLPDRRVFLDYCHLNANGIQIAMGAVAAGLLHALDGSNLSYLSLSSKSASPSSAVQAEAMFLAAVHNAHWYQKAELVEYFCHEAVRFDPNIAHVMASFVEVQTRRSPMLMCKAAERLADPQFPALQRYLFRFNIHQLDRVLLDAVATAIVKHDDSSKEQTSRLRVNEQSVVHTQADLLERYYLSSAKQEFAQQEAEQMKLSETHGDYYRAYSPESRFLFVGEAGYPVSLSLACRLPALGSVEGYVLVEFNGVPQGQALVSRKWQTWDISIPPESTKDGINEVTVRWPAGEIPGKIAVETAADKVLAGVFPDFYPTFGEIHSFTASVPVGLDSSETSDQRSAVSLTS